MGRVFLSTHDQPLTHFARRASLPCPQEDQRGLRHRASPHPRGPGPSAAATGSGPAPPPPATPPSSTSAPSPRFSAPSAAAATATSPSCTTRGNGQTRSTTPPAPSATPCAAAPGSWASNGGCASSPPAPGNRPWPACSAPAQACHTTAPATPPSRSRSTPTSSGSPHAASGHTAPATEPRSDTPASGATVADTAGRRYSDRHGRGFFPSVTWRARREPAPVFSFALDLGRDLPGAELLDHRCPGGIVSARLPGAGGGMQGGLDDGKEGFPGVGVGGHHHGDRPGEDAEENLQARGAVAVRAAALAPVAGLAGCQSSPSPGSCGPSAAVGWVTAGCR